MDDAGSLANLRGLALPPAVPFWPPAPGTAILLLALLACVAISLWQLAARYRANAFRREAAREIAAVDPASGEAPTQLFAILKRVALVMHPREDVAPLTGGALVAFLAKDGAIDAGLARRLSEAAFDPHGRVDPNDVSRFAAEATVLVRRER
jgi:hypothetical protein